MAKVIDLHSSNKQTHCSNTLTSQSGIPSELAIRAMLYDELSWLSSDEEMIADILVKMKPFISTLDFNFDLNIELTEENKALLTQTIPSIQELQTHFDSVLLSFISERILHEIHCFHLEQKCNNLLKQTKTLHPLC